MNVKKAKTEYSIESVLSILGFSADKKKSKSFDLWYTSPFRPSESTPSFHVNTRADIFKDFGDSEKGGDLIWFVQRYLQVQGEPHSVSHALKWLNELRPCFKRPISSSPSPVRNKKNEAYRIVSIKPIFSKSLVAYLKKRKIPLALANQYLKQVYFEHNQTKKKFYGLGFKTRAGGIDIRNALGFKTSIGTKDITVVNGSSSSNAIEVFEGVMDFLSPLAITSAFVPTNDCLILNSASLLEQALNYIEDKGYDQLILWLDNDKAGSEFKDKLIQRYSDRPVSILDKSYLYKDFKDLNEWLEYSPMSMDEKKKLLRLNLSETMIGTLHRLAGP